MTIEELDDKLNEVYSVFGEANFIRKITLVYKPLGRLTFIEGNLYKHLANNIVLVLASAFFDLNTALTATTITKMENCYSVAVGKEECIMLDHNCFITHIYFDNDFDPVLSIQLDGKEYFYDCYYCPNIEYSDIANAILDNGGNIV